MHRLQIYLPPVTMKWLRAESRRLGVSVAEIIRRTLDASREAKP
jgi:hypothetical protein